MISNSSNPGWNVPRALLHSFQRQLLPLSSPELLRRGEPLKRVQARLGATSVLQYWWNVLFFHPVGARPLAKILPEGISIRLRHWSAATLGIQPAILGKSTDHPGTLGKREDVVSIFLSLHDWTQLGSRIGSSPWCFLVSARWGLLSECIVPLARVNPVAPSRDSACPPACPSVRARARPSVPRPSLPPQLALPGRAPAAGAATAAAPGPRSAARRPGTRRGAGAAPNWPRVSPSPVSGIQESLSLCSPPGVLPRRALLVWPGPKCRMGLPIRGPVATRTDTAPLIWDQDTS